MAIGLHPASTSGKHSSKMKLSGVYYTAWSHHREELMGFKRDHTCSCMSASGRRGEATKHEDLRCALMGNAIQATVLAHLLAPQLVAWGYLKEDPQVSTSARNAQRQPAEDRKEEQVMVRALFTLQTHRGGEIRLEAGPAGKQPLNAAGSAKEIR